MSDTLPPSTVPPEGITPGSCAAGRAAVNYGELRPRSLLPRRVLLSLLGVAALLGGVFYWTFGRMWERWNNSTGYYSHGPLVLPIAVAAAWLIIRRHGLPMRSTVISRFWGLAILTGALLAHLACMFARVTFVSGFAMLAAIAGIMLYLGGFAMLRRLWFPVAFLAFMVPLPDITIYAVNFHLKMIAAQVSTWLVNLMGIVVFRQGSDVFLEGNKVLTVEDVCSGLRSLISLLAFATLFTYACRLRGYKRLVLFLSAAPIALAANVVRISVLIVVAHHFDVKLAMPGGWVHDLMGFVVFVVAFCFMFLEELLLDPLPGPRREARANGPAWTAATAEAS